jgi:hypothetical protein
MLIVYHSPPRVPSLTFPSNMALLGANQVLAVNSTLLRSQALLKRTPETR